MPDGNPDLWQIKNPENGQHTRKLYILYVILYTLYIIYLFVLLKSTLLFNTKILTVHFGVYNTYICIKYMSTIVQNIPELGVNKIILL